MQVHSFLLRPNHKGGHDEAALLTLYCCCRHKAKWRSKFKTSHFFVLLISKEWPRKCRCILSCYDRPTKADMKRRHCSLSTAAAAIKQSGEANLRRRIFLFC